MATLQQILDDIRVRLPMSTATFTDTVIIGWINSAQNEIWRYMASTEMASIDVINGQSVYNMESDMRIDMIKSVQVSDSTTIDGTEEYITYDYCGPDDELSGNQYYDALGQIGFYPEFSTSEGGKKIKITYEASPVALSTDTLTTVPSINTEFQDVLKFRAMKNIAQSGNAPDVELANNYQAEEDSIMKKIKMDYFKRRFRKPRKTWDYRANWYKG